MSNKSMQKKYTSDIDKLLQSFDKEHPEKSESQQKEIEKYDRIYKLRDKSISVEKSDTLWDNF